MRWVSAVSTVSPLEAAVREVTATIQRDLDGARPDLAVAFVSEQHQGEYERLPALLRGQLAPRLVIGCSAGGVIGGGHEIERQAGVSVTAALLPDVELTPFHLEGEALVDRNADAAEWERLVGVARSRQP